MPLIRKPGAAAPAVPDESGATLAQIAGSDADQRWAVARAAVGKPGAAAALGAALLVESDTRVREAMLTSLARIATPESAEWLLQFLRSDDANLRTGAMDALRAMKDAVQPYLPRLLADADADVRNLACELVRVLPGEAASRLLCGLLETEADANVCAAAIEVLAEVGGPESLVTLARCEARFRATPFLAFSIRTAADRIRSTSARPRV